VAFIALSFAPVHGARDKALPVATSGEARIAIETAEIAEMRRGRVDENLVGEKVLGCALKVHRALGPGLLEGAYEACLAHELMKSGIVHRRQVQMPVLYDGVQIDLGYRLDLLVEERIVVEIKAVERLTDVHRAQILSYLKLGDYRLGYLLNFNVKMLKDGISRIANGL
jgi:GxxExxY protein